MPNIPPASDDSSRDPWIFREVREPRRTIELLEELEKSISARNSTLTALIQCGQLESALADAQSPAAPMFSGLTNEIAAHYWGSAPPPKLPLATSANSLPPTVCVSPPEGFTYYAVHPLDYAVAARTLASARPVAVIGLRSIGTTLSAVVTATLNSVGTFAERMTVRPVGHPYNRHTAFTQNQISWLRQFMGRDPNFIIVDEGPGRSGSSFLSVAEALERTGVPPERITMLGSHQPDANSLCAADAGRRWARYRYVAATRTTLTRFENFIYIGGGDWRPYFIPKNTDVPACWPQMERMKFLTPDRMWILKFEGLGAMGHLAQQRAETLAEAGFGPPVENAGDGFAAYPAIAGCPMRESDTCLDVVRRLAQYCAFRFANFRCSDGHQSQLLNATRSNLELAFGIDWNDQAEHLLSGPAVVTDGRMQPHEWIRAKDGRMLKTDAVSHGDDHFFPGPCNIAWDLAGAIAEWNLSGPLAALLVKEFRRLSGFDPREILPSLLLAYTIFRMSYCQMALTSSMHGDEELRVRQACRRYRTYAERLLSPISEPFQENLGKR